MHKIPKSADRKMYTSQNCCEERLLKTLFFALIDSILQNGIIWYVGNLTTNLRIVFQYPPFPYNNTNIRGQVLSLISLVDLKCCHYSMYLFLNY